MVRQLSIIGLLAIYALFLGEVYIRVLAPVPIMPRYVAATDFGIRGNTPGSRYTHVTPEYKINFSINGRGVRSTSEIDYIKPANVKRIVSLGDSFMLGYGAKDDETFLYHMDQGFESNGGCQMEVINLGVSGHGTAEELITLREEGLKYAPDLVLVSWHHTDLRDNTRSGLFKVGDGGVESLNTEYLPSVKLRERLFAIAVYRFIAENSQFYGWFRELAGDFVKNAMSAYKEFKRGGKAKATNKLGGKQDELLAAALLGEMRQLAKKNGAEFLVLAVPRRLGRSEFMSTLPVADLSPEITVYDPMPDFALHKEKLLYWEDSAGHFTPFGNQLVGQGLAKTIVDNNLIDCAQ